MADSRQTLIQKIGALPAGRLAQVEDFVDFILEREGVRAFAAVGTSAFAAAWDNPGDAAYDAL